MLCSRGWAERPVRRPRQTFILKHTKPYLSGPPGMSGHLVSQRIRSMIKMSNSLPSFSINNVTHKYEDSQASVFLGVNVTRSCSDRSRRGQRCSEGLGVSSTTASPPSLSVGLSVQVCRPRKTKETGKSEARTHGKCKSKIGLLAPIKKVISYIRQYN